MNTKSLKLNGIISLLNRFISIICSLILPRLFITAYGSEVNGLMSSISQYLTLISLLDMGMGAVIQANVYQPLVEKDYLSLSTIYYKSQNFFNKIGLALILYIIGLCFFLPRILSGPFSQTQIISFVAILSLSHLLQFFVGITSQIILGSDQKNYIKEILQGLTNIANLCLSYFLIKQGSSILIVRLVSALVFILPPIYISFYVHKHYHISKNNIDKNYRIKQQWYGIGQHIAYTIQESTDIVILSTFASLTDVSIYAIYNTVFQGMKTLLNAATSGLRPFLGRALYATNPVLLTQQFRKLEWLLHTVSTLLLTLTFQLITPFVLLYTASVTDTDYNQPIFGYVMTFSLFLYAIRLPYRTLVFAEGEFKKTQLGSYLEAFINLFLSLLLVHPFGITGVAIGTTFSQLFSLFYYIWYCYKHILISSAKLVYKQLAINLSVFLFSNVFFFAFLNTISNIRVWIVHAIISMTFTLFTSLIMSYIFTKMELLEFIRTRH
ncbi:TPA: polysaccharide biosynthesis C-terminal domain-containing protein [Streptococcus suis]